MSDRIYMTRRSPYWHMDITHPITGARRRISTKTKDRHMALAMLEAEIRKTRGLAEDASFLDVLRLYQNPETNPRRTQYLQEGRSYGNRYARQVAAAARNLERILMAKAPVIIRKRIWQIAKIEIKTIRGIIVEELGATRNAQMHFRVLRAIFSQASEDCLIQVSPFEGIRDIRIQESARPSYPEDMLASMIQHKDLWPDPLHWAFFTLLATTGMRRGEALVLTTGQIFDGTCTIDRALKDYDGEIGLPKWGLTRVIPLSAITLQTLEETEPRDGRYFPYSNDWVNHVFYSARTVGVFLFPGNRLIQQMSAHTLRHSLHSNLLANGASSTLAAEYLSWHHQELLDVQKRYTHIYARKLKTIADLIDELYGEPIEERESRSI